MQLYELEAWLGNDHELNEDQLTQLLDEANEIEERYPDADDQPERDAALSTAYQLLLGQDEVIEELARKRDAAKAAESQALAGLRQAALMLIPNESRTESGFAKQAGVDRMAVRGWLGKR
ncbi:hypothetical protein [Streptomyces osmaniensis]|uniref:Uncharacterized protein n=1 Tax=Streptomyces osmaniensis TaxID=593134 RepID=A0ABP6YTK4_9ACTN|nr:hypothetical protein KJK32_46665 [Streptomyces sp. JCM17656]